jgi:3-oxoacyl-[acyl-carrier-protein] synthase-1
MPEEGAAIMAVGMITAVGISARQTAASARAGIARQADSSIYNKQFQPMKMALVPEDALPPLEPALESVQGLTSRQIRMLRLAGVALQEVLADVPDPQRVPVLLGTPEAWPGRADPAGEKFLHHLAVQSRVAFDLSRSKMFPVGRAAGLYALQEALQRLKTGQTEQIVVGGVDSYLDLYLLGTLDMEGRVLAEGVMDGFVPGEGAGFLLLRKDIQSTTGKAPIAMVLGVATGVEKGHRYSEEIYRGDGLAGTLQQLFRSVPQSKDKVRTVYAGFNGENFWAKEWGVAYMRSQEKFETEFRVEHPADCFGDPGAALGPLTVGLAAIGMQKGYLKGPSLVWCSSDREPRAAALVQGVEN